MNKNQIISHGKFGLSNRTNLQNKIKIESIDKDTKEKKVITLSVSKRLNQLRDKLSKLLSHKKDGKYTYNNLPIDSVIEIQKAELTEFLQDNEVHPTEKGFETLKEFAFHGKRPTKADNFPIESVDYVLSTEQDNEIKLIQSTDKSWLGSEDGAKVETNFAQSMVSNGTIGRRHFEIGCNNGKQFICGSYSIASEFTPSLKQDYNNRLAKKNNWLLSENTEEKQIEKMTIPQLKLELNSLNLPSKGKKSELVERLISAKS